MRERDVDVVEAMSTSLETIGIAHGGDHKVPVIEATTRDRTEIVRHALEFLWTFDSVAVL